MAIVGPSDAPENDDRDSHPDRQASALWPAVILALCGVIGPVVLAANPDAFRRIRQLLGLSLVGVVLVIILVIAWRFPFPLEWPPTWLS